MEEDKLDKPDKPDKPKRAYTTPRKPRKYPKPKRKKLKDYPQELKAKAKPSTDPKVKGKRIKTKYKGVYFEYVTLEGKERWRAHITYYPLDQVNPKTGLPIPDENGKLPKKSLIVLGSFDNPEEAADCRDEVIRQYNLPFRLNKPNTDEIDTSIPRSFSRDAAELLVRYGESVDYTVLAGLINETPRKVREFLKANNITPKIMKSDIVIFDIRDNYEPLE